MDLTIDRLKTMLSYSPDTGVFIWLSGNRAGLEAGDLKASGYRYIQLDRRRYLAGRLAWLYMTGRWPEQQIDHKNRCPADNRWDNLREATQSQNQMNKPGWGASGVKGVHFQKARGKYRAYLNRDGREVHLGYFHTAIEAAEARRVAANRLHGTFQEESCQAKPSLRRG